ncbi:FAD-dependent oxidoreductase [Amycolatopsis sp. MtRt-6]|uniref:FAD-dependent oxidoreductase n=1 Tax=Amycolatopsis sp. MtRt-6 TaxID=2792782 RepID=UPI001F5C63F9|nr:FAD-dependent oxidoreductase [Amycolatopsis sp. MtRt-6]
MASSRQQAWADSAGITVLRGEGRLAGPHTVAVGGQACTAGHVVVATGSAPVIPPVPGLRELPGLWTNREATGATEIPRRLLVPGAGPTGVELSEAFTRLGAEVTLVDGADRVLPREPRALGEALGDALRADGITLHLGRHASAARERRVRPRLPRRHPAARRPAAGRHRAAAARRWHRARHRRPSTRTRAGSRSTTAWPPATGCGPSATSPGSGT